MKNRLVRVTKKERDLLVAQGVSLGENGISKTHSHHNSYYMCETFKNMQKLYVIRDIKKPNTKNKHYNKRKGD